MIIYDAVKPKDIELVKAEAARVQNLYKKYAHKTIDHEPYFLLNMLKEYQSTNKALARSAFGWFSMVWWSRSIDV